ncbi:hypothetical protein C5S42_00640 [Candidatus Methanomarinus sp.]|nr:hypothetical protein C5S42_00640 [ANME-2 cluster archaeon]
MNLFPIKRIISEQKNNLLALVKPPDNPIEEINILGHIPGYNGGGINPNIPENLYPENIINTVNNTAEDVFNNSMDKLNELKPDVPSLVPPIILTIVLVGGGLYVAKELWWSKAMENKETLEGLGVTKEGVSAGVDDVLNKGTKAAALGGGALAGV